MPKYRIKAPDGKTYEVTAPEGATQAQVLAYVQHQHAAQGSDPSLPQAPSIPDLQQQYWQAAKDGDIQTQHNVYQLLKQFHADIGHPQGANLGASPAHADQGMNAADRFEVGYGRAGAAAGQAVTQLGMHAGQALGITDPAKVAAYDNAVKNEAQTYNAGVGSTVAGNMGNIVGGVVNTAPLAEAAIPAKGAGLLPAIGRSAAVSGAADALTQPVTSGADGSFAKNKAEQVGTAAAVGGAVPAAARGVMRTAENVVPGNLVQRVSNQFMKRANKTPFAADSEALGQRTGIEFTPGQVSGSKMQTGLENLSRQSLFSADTAFAADTKVANQAVNYINKTMDKISPDRVSREGVGQKVQSALRGVVNKIAKSREQTAAQQYGAISSALGDTPVVRYDNTKKVLTDILNEYQDVPGKAAASMRKQVEGMLEDVNKKPAFSLQSAQMARSAYGRAARGSADVFKNVRTSEQARLAKRLYGAITDDIEQSAAAFDGGPRSGPGLMVNTPNGMISRSGLAEAWRQANENYRNYSKLIDAVEASPIKRLIGDKVDVADFMTVNKIPPEKVIKTLNGMSPSEIKMVRRTMEKAAPDTWNEYKRLIVQNALDEAQTFPGSAGAKTLPMNANKFIRSLGGDNPAKIEKLRATFSPDEMSQINDAFMALRRLGDKFGANHSGTAVANEALGILRSGIRGSVNVASQAIGMRKIARVMLNANGRRALVEMSRLPPQSRQYASLAGYIASLESGPDGNNVGPDKQVGYSAKANH